MIPENPEVSSFLAVLDHPMKEGILKLRDTIKKAYSLEESIKWNAPNYSYKETDIITFNLPPKKDRIRLIFHRGAKIKTSLKERMIPDPTGLLVWAANDRAIAEFKNKASIETLETTIIDWVNQWVEAFQQNNF